MAGIRTPFPILASNGGDGGSMQEQMPQQYEELVRVCNRLELHFKDMQDIEFTIYVPVVVVVVVASLQLQLAQGRR